MILEDEIEVYGGENHTTNNQMEMMAVIEALKWANPSKKIQIYTDSNYVQKGMTVWMEGWKRRGWKNVKNREYWEALLSLSKNLDIEWFWIKGHANHKWNEKADELANLGRYEL